MVVSKVPRWTNQCKIWSSVLRWRYLYFLLQYQRRKHIISTILDREHRWLFKSPLTCLKENVVHHWKWKVNSNVNDAGCNTGVIVGMYKPSSQCFKRTIYFLHCFFSSSLWKTSCQFIILPTCVQNKSKQTEKGRGGGGGCKQRWKFSSNPLISSFF